jgi:branched-chain amino acid transport system substrate-binding protein
MKNIALCLILLVFIIACTQAPSSQEPIKVGMFGAFSGKLAPIGQQELIAAEYAVEKINAQGGINGRPLQLLIEDTKCNPKDAVTAFTKLSETADAHIIMGGLCSGETVAPAPMANEKQIVLLSALSSGPQITTLGDYVFRTNPVDDGSFFANFVEEKSYTRVAVISEQTDFSQGVKKAMLVKFDAAGIEYLNEDVAPDTTDYRTALLKLKQFNPELLIINTNSFTAGVEIYKQAEPMGLKNAFGSRGFETGSADVLSQVEGVSFYGSFGVVDETTPEVVEMTRRYKEKYNTLPMSSFAFASQYDDVMLVADALRACAPQDGQCIKDFLYSVRERQGLMGVFGFDSNGDPIGLKYNAVTVRNGTILLVS